jgi:TPR repeat protein
MRTIISLLFLCISITVFSQGEISVISFKQSSSDIAARTNQRDDTKGIPCALVKVQFPMRNVLFEGDIAGEVAFKTNEYWVYMPEKSSRLEVKAPSCKPLVVDFAKHGIASVESKGTYELCLLKKEKDALQLYNDGMVALAKNDIVTAFDNLQKASDSGYAPATYQLGATSIVPFDRGYDEDPNTQESYQEAYNYYVKAAEKDYPEAQIALGKLLLDYKTGFPEEITKISINDNLKNQSAIMNLIKQAADNGMIDAQYLMLSDKQWCSENANKGVAVAEFGMGLFNDQTFSTIDYPMLESLDITPSDNIEQAVSWYQKAAEKGLDIALWRLGDLYAQGVGVSKDINKAIELKTKAAEQGNFLFQYMMGMMYAYGEIGGYEYYAMYNTELGGGEMWDTITQDATKADYWLRKLNHKQFTKSELLNIIDCNGLFSSTLDVLAATFMKEENYEKAIYWYQRKMDLGFRDAYCNLGEMYIKGIGISKNYEKAREMFEKADMDDDHFGDGYSGSLRDRAKAYLGVIYRDGLGVESDVMKAKTLLMASASKNDAKGMYELAMLLEREGNSEASKLFNELKRGWGHNDDDDYYKNKAQASAEKIVFNAEEEAAASISALTEQIEAQDASKFQEVLSTVQEKIKEIIGANPEIAKEYVTKIQDFLKKNAEKIKAFAGENAAVQTALAAFTAAPAESVVDGLMQTKEH